MAYKLGYVQVRTVDSLLAQIGKSGDSDDLRRHRGSHRVQVATKCFHASCVVLEQPYEQPDDAGLVGRRIQIGGRRLDQTQVSEQPAAEPREIAGSMPTAAELREIAGMPERQASLQELESKLDSYIHDVENGTTVVVSRDGRQVARIIPETNSAEQKRAALKASGTFDWSGRRPKSRRPSVRLRDGGSVSDIIINERR